MIFTAAKDREDAMSVDSGLKVVIIGGGLVGCACGYYLARSKINVTILEKDFLASGASGANAGLLALGMPDLPQTAHLYRESRRIMQKEIESEIGDFEYVHGGMLFAAMDENDVHALQKRGEGYRAVGIKSHFLNSKEVIQAEPILNPDVAGGLFVPETGHFNPFLLVQGLARCVVDKGGKIFTSVCVNAIKKDETRFSIHTDGETFFADAVVVANGWQASELVRPMGIVLPVVPARGQIIISEPLAPLTEKAVHSPYDIYMRQTKSGTCQIGSHTEFAGPNKTVTLAKLCRYSEDITRIIPFFKHIRMLRAYAGLRPLTPDSLPIVGKAPGIENLILACGHSRTGASLSLVTGKMVSELLINGESSLDISPWSIDRFKGKTFKEPTNDER